MSRPRANLADLQAAARGGDALKVASALLGAPVQELTSRPVFKGRSVDDMFPASYPSSWLNRATDRAFEPTQHDLGDELRRVLEELYPEDADADSVRISVASVLAGIPPVTPMEKVADRLYREIVRDLGGRHVNRKSTAASMKKDPRNYGPASEVVTRDAAGNYYAEDGRLISPKKAAKKLRKLQKED